MSNKLKKVIGDKKWLVERKTQLKKIVKKMKLWSIVKLLNKIIAGV